MAFFAEYFGDRKFLNLADERKDIRRNVSRPKTVDNKSQLNRVTKESIRTLYHNDWFTFSTVNITTTLFSKPRIKIVSKDEEPWNKFFDNMRDYGSNTSLKRLRKELKRDGISYGASYIEYVYDVTGKVILDLKRIEASKLEHAKDKKGYLILDEKGNSVGYVLHLGPNADLRSKGDEIPLSYDGVIDMQMGDIFLDPSRIAEFPLYKLGNDTEAIGIIEPAIQQTKRRMDLETAQVNALWIRGSAPVFMEVGDERHEPNPQMMEDAIDMVANLRHSQAVAVPFYNKFGTINAKVDDTSTDVMNYLMAGSAGAGNVPLPFVTGAGEATNRSTLKTQRELFEMSIQDHVECFDEDWNNQVMAKLSEVNGYPEATIVSEDVRLESNDETSKRLKTYAEIGEKLGTPVLSPQEVRTEILRIEGIKEDGSYEKFLKEKEKEKKELAKKEEISDQEDEKEDEDEEDDKTTKE